MTTDYKDTLNLPRTAFPMKASLAQREPELLAYWQEINLYQQLRELGKQRPKFVMHDGPPYANGAIHLGTTMNKVLKDIVTKSKTLSGFDTPYIPGWDCHGLPIEHKVEKKVGKVGVKIEAKPFRQACRKFAASQVDLQREDFKRLGVLADWEHPYLTMDYCYEADVIRALSKIVANGHMLRGYKPVHWCTSCGSALAEAEVEYKDKTSSAIDVNFLAADSAALAKCFALTTPVENIGVPIWTTTPWTLPANQAVTVNPGLDYVLVASDDNSRHLVLAKELAEEALTRYGIEKYKILATVQGSELEEIQLQHPFEDRTVPIILGMHVTVDAGTGNVHTAPAHGIDDYVVGQKYKLPHNNPVDARSCFHKDVAIVGGMHVFKANSPIVEVLKENGNLLHHCEIEHSYPHCWRHKTPLIFRATPQWFISMEANGLRRMALSAIEEAEWIPGWGETRIRRMIETRPDWCISRQRYWGTPIAVFVHNETGELHPDTVELMQTVANQVEKSGIDAWYDLDPKALLGADAENYTKVTDTLDVWFDSGVSHTCVLEERAELYVPADLYLEGSDQHRGWFQTSLLTSLAIRNAAPFKTVLTHGYVVDAKGHKMSKSVGNTILPPDVIKKLGADILRLWAAATDHTGDVSVSDEILKRISDAYRRIRNTARFLLSNLNDFDPQNKLAANELLDLDKWAIEATKRLQTKIINAYEHYHFQSIYQMIHNFCSVELGSFYLDIIKDRQYTSSKNGIPRRSGQTAMYYILEALVRWLAPVLSFTAEEIWRVMPGERNASVFLNEWYTEFPEFDDADNQQQYWQWLMQVRDAVNRELETRRNQGEIGSGLDASITLYADQSALDKLNSVGDELRFILITSSARVMAVEAKQLSAVETEIPGVWVQVDKTTAQKCVRCWQRREDVGADAAHPELCGRCVLNVSGAGEARQYA